MQIIDDLLKKEHGLSADYCLNRFKLANDKVNLFHINTSKSNRKLLSQDIDNVTERGRYLIYFFITEIIREYENLVTISGTFNNVKKSNLIFEFCKKINLQEILDMLILIDSNNGNSKIFEKYKLLLDTIIYPENEKAYFYYKKIFMSNINILTPDEMRFHFSRLIRNCVMRKNQVGSEKKYEIELFKLYEYMLNTKAYKSSLSKHLHVELYRNVLILGLRLRKFTWVIKFIKKFNKELSPKKRVNIYYYSLAMYYFNHKIYKNALENFHKIEFSEFIFKVDMKNHMLMAYFELKNFEQALSMIDNYYHFLSNDETLSDAKKKFYRNFIKIVQTLILHFTSSKKLSTINLELLMKRDFPFKEWVTSKYEKLIRPVSSAILPKGSMSKAS